MTRRLLPLIVALAALMILAAPAQAHLPVFTHGVASGDVTPTSAILWSRIDRAAAVKLDVSTNPDLTGRKALVRAVRATAENDFTLKVDATGLQPGTTYFYRFRHGTSTSPIGSFETAPSPTVEADARFGYTGDSDGTKTNRPPTHKSFEVLDRLREDDPDFWAYLGDIIYSDSSLRPSPATTLPEYRDAYKENRTYPALTNLLAATSTYAQLDDHEVQNDFDGQTVDPARYVAGREAFLEYMPVRETNLLEDPTCAGDPLYREFSWGSEIDIIIPDERSCRSGSVEAACPTPPDHPLGPIDPAPRAPQAIRTAFGLPPPPPECIAALSDTNRTMLGPVQKQAFKDALLNSTAKFKLVINEVPIQQFWALPYDRWEGYEAERAEMINFVRNNDIEGVLFLTTDTHATLINQVYVDRCGEAPLEPCDSPTDPVPVFDEAVTGPIATFTFEQEVVDFGGALALLGVNGLMSNQGMDCRQLNEFSYGLVNAAPAAATPTIAFKDDTGAPIANQGPTGGPVCVYPPAPPVP